MSISTEVLTSYKKIDETYIDGLLKKETDENNKKIVVLDDDPTGVQTVHDISVYTNWDKDSIRQGFEEENNLFYVLTNSRGFTVEQTTKAHNEIAAVVDEVAKETGKEYIFISRSDSTLRGHYPLETELLKSNYEKNTGKVIIEAFEDRDPMSVPGVLCTSHGPFSWGKDAAEAVHNAVVLEEVAKMATRTEMLNPQVKPAVQYVQDKHYFRKHGPGAYYGQK